MRYTQAIDFIKKSQKNGCILGLDNMRTLCEYIGNPQNKLKAVHIAGTNGKGSVGAFVANILIEAGFKVGRYVSPAVMEYREIFRLNDEIISEEDFCQCTEVIKDAVCKMIAEKNFSPTVFEIETAIAFYYFYKQKCDIVVIETGMGGRLDATNIIDNTILSIITPISMDHTDFLGDSIEKIAYEKSGIIKQNSKVVTIEQEPKVMNVLTNTCYNKNTSLTVVKKIDKTNIKITDSGVKFSFGEYGNINLTMKALYQVDNCTLAITACEILKELGFFCSYENIKNGVYKTKWIGRFEILGDNPRFIIDGAHNEAGAKALKNSLIPVIKKNETCLILGVFKDKDYDKIAKEITPLADSVYTITPDNIRGLDSNILATVVSKYNKNVISFNKIEKAINFGIKNKYKNIVCCGSLSFLGNLKKYIKSGDI